MIKKILAKYVVKDAVIRDISMLVGGAGVAQLINLFTLPLLTRLYEPSDFSMLAVYIAMVTILSSVACLRLDITIPLPRQIGSAFNLLFFSISLAFSLSVLLLSFLYLFKDEFLVASKLPAWAIYLIPLGVFLTASYSAIRYWFVREKEFSTIAKVQVNQTISCVAIQVYGGYLGCGFLFILGYLANSFVGFFSLSKKIIIQKRKFFKWIKVSTITLLIKKYADYPKYSMMEVLANNLGIQLPIILIGTLTVGSDAGYLVLAMKVMQAPMALIGNSVAQVYYSYAVEKESDGVFAKFTESTISGLMKTGVGPIILAGIVSPQVFSILFGTDWVRAGELVSWMSACFVLQFIASPISMVMHIKKKQKEMLILTIGGLFIRVGSVLMACFFWQGFIVEAYAISGAIFYFICLLVFSFFGLLSISTWVKIINSNGLVIFLWAFFGLVMKSILMLFL